MQKISTSSFNKEQSFFEELIFLRSLMKEPNHLHKLPADYVPPHLWAPREPESAKNRFQNVCSPTFQPGNVGPLNFSRLGTEATINFAQVVQECYQMQQQQQQQQHAVPRMSSASLPYELSSFSVNCNNNSSSCSNYPHDVPSLTSQSLPIIRPHQQTHLPLQPHGAQMNFFGQRNMSTTYVCPTQPSTFTRNQNSDTTSELPRQYIPAPIRKPNVHPASLQNYWTNEHTGQIFSMQQLVNNPEPSHYQPAQFYSQASDAQQYNELPRAISPTFLHSSTPQLPAQAFDHRQRMNNMMEGSLNSVEELIFFQELLQEAESWERTPEKAASPQLKSEPLHSEPEAESLDDEEEFSENSDMEEDEESELKSEASPNASMKKSKKQIKTKTAQKTTSTSKPQAQENVDFGSFPKAKCKNWLPERTYIALLQQAAKGEIKFLEDDFPLEAGSIFFTKRPFQKSWKLTTDWKNCGRKKEKNGGSCLRVFYRRHKDNPDLRKRMILLRDRPEIVLHHLTLFNRRTPFRRSSKEKMIIDRIE